MSDGFWSVAPFVSHDGVDSQGVRAEVLVTFGFGKVKRIDRKNKAAKVDIQCAHPKVTPGGWVPMNEKVFEMIEEASEKDIPIYFRAEKLRNKGVDRTLPISTWKTLEESAQNTRWSLAAVRFNEEDEWVFNRFAVTNLKEDPISGDGERPSALNMDLDSAPAAASSSAPAVSNVLAPLSDGQVNPGSDSTMSGARCVFFVAQWDKDHEGESLMQIGEKKRVAVAKMVLSSIKELQVRMFNEEIEVADLEHPSFVHAETIIQEVIKHYLPLSQEIFADKASALTWREDVVEKAESIWRWSISEVS